MSKMQLEFFQTQTSFIHAVEIINDEKTHQNDVGLA